MNATRPNSAAGTLYVVATPIGNMGDITYRAVDVLHNADLIAAEDTRHTARLLAHYAIETPLISCHEHNESQRISLLLQKLESGGQLALVSDAGTPMVSDPGYRLVAAALEAGIKVVPIPGACAAVAALSVSGLAVDRFCFAGFLPKKKKQRQEMLTGLASAEETLIFYESPRRLEALLRDLQDHLGDRTAVVAREITKRYEEFLRGTLSVLLDAVSRRESVKGEVTVLVSGFTEDNRDPAVLDRDLRNEIDSALSGQTVSPSKLAAELARKYRMPKGRVYKMILEIQKNQ
ncbi:MAG: 16S rRNA (cytidine(1402)-2'-O)-methyltransferase [Desulfobacterales bacterium]|nr:16S rRNA (cytidine(1402)-2'-O)-methyltransferase [Desulfobacterales bacterium]